MEFLALNSEVKRWSFTYVWCCLAMLSYPASTMLLALLVMFVDVGFYGDLICLVVASCGCVSYSLPFVTYWSFSRENQVYSELPPEDVARIHDEIEKEFETEWDEEEEGMTYAQSRRLISLIPVMQLASIFGGLFTIGWIALRRF